MSIWSDVAERLRAVFFRGRRERDMDEELQFHVERETEELIRRGASPDEARRKALLAFGGVEQTKEEVRDAAGARLMTDAASDLRYAVRSLLRQPGFTLAAVLVLGVGIGAATAVFTVVDAVLLSDLSYPESHRLVRVYNRNSPTNQWQLSVADYNGIMEHQRSFEAFGLAQLRQSELAGTGGAERINTGRVTFGFFDALRVRAGRGRLLTPEDAVPGAPAVVVMSHRMATRLLGGDSAAIGRTVTLDGISHTVVGVLPPGVNNLANIPADAYPAMQPRPPQRRGPFGLRGIGRLKDGVTLEMAAADLREVSRRIFPIWAAGFQDSSAVFTPYPLRETIVGSASRSIGLFAAAVALVLLIAIANVTTLVLIRTAAREQELGVRTALGAGSGRLARLLFTENMVLAIATFAVAVIVTWAGVSIVQTYAPGLPRRTEIALGARSIAFAALVALISGTLTGIAPLLSAFRSRGFLWLRADTRRVGSGQGSQRLRGALVAGEFALALPTLLGAGLLLNSFVRLQRVDPGFDPAGVHFANIALPAARYPDNPEVQTFWRQAIARVAELPGVTSVGVSTALPPSQPGDENNFDLRDKPVPVGTSQPVSPWSFVSRGYFDVLGVRLLDGRHFTDADTGAVAPVIIVSRSWAEHYYPRENPLGKALTSGGCTECPGSVIVGVVSDVKYLGLRGTSDAVYGPLTQDTPRGMNLMVRSRDGIVTGARIRDVIRTLDADLATTEGSLSDAFDGSLAAPRRWTAMLGGFAAASGLLAALGVFGLMSYVVRQRRREIGVRLALGATPQAVMLMIVRGGMRYALIGCAIGLVLSLIEARWLRTLLFEVGAMDPLTIAAISAMLLLAALLASWLPGRRAARIHPVEAISSD